MITQRELDSIRRLWELGYTPPSLAIQQLISTAHAYLGNGNVVISQAEYDWLVQRSHRLESLEL